MPQESNTPLPTWIGKTILLVFCGPLIHAAGSERFATETSVILVSIAAFIAAIVAFASRKKRPRPMAPIAAQEVLWDTELDGDLPETALSLRVDPGVTAR